MHLIIGLGNPGKEYESTRHNAGFDAVLSIANSNKVELSVKRSVKAMIGTFDLEENKVMLCMPQTFMNNSGQSVRDIVKNSNIEHHDIIVIHDELDLPVGTVKIKKAGGSAGHKGIDSIAECLGTKEFIRVRIGIGRPDRESVDQSDYVLSKVPRSQAKEFDEAVVRAAMAAENIVKFGLHKAMNEFNKSADI